KGASRRQTNPATGQHHAWVDYTMTFAGESLCGRNVAALLFPDDDFPSARGFYCPQNVMVLPQDGVVAFFSSNSSKSPVLAHVRVVDGELAVTRLDVSPDPKRNSLYSVRFLDARLPGWRRVQTGWRDTVLLRLSPFKVVLLGEGELLDVDGEVAFLLVRPGKKVVSP